MKNRIVIAAGTSMIMVTGLLGLSSSYADIEKKIQYRAYCVDERVSLGGWVSFEEDAEDNADAHLEHHPEHEVVIEEDDYS